MPYWSVEGESAEDGGWWFDNEADYDEWSAENPDHGLVVSVIPDDRVYIARNGKLLAEQAAALRIEVVGPYRFYPDYVNDPEHFYEGTAVMEHAREASDRPPSGE